MIFHIERFYTGKKDRMDKAEAERVAAAAKKKNRQGRVCRLRACLFGEVISPLICLLTN